MTSPISIDDLTLLRLTLSPQEIVTLCSPHLASQQVQWLRHSDKWWFTDLDVDARLPAIIRAANRKRDPRGRGVYVDALVQLCLPFFCVQHGLPLTAITTYDDLFRTTNASACTKPRRELHAESLCMVNMYTAMAATSWTSLGRRAVEAISQDLNGKLTPAACRNGALAVLDTWLCL